MKLNATEMKTAIFEMEAALERLRAAVEESAERPLENKTEEKPSETASLEEKAPAENYFRAFSLVKGLY